MQKNSLKMRIKTLEDSSVIKVLIYHPFESGRQLYWNRELKRKERREKEYIKKITFFLNDLKLLTIHTTTHVARNPLFTCETVLIKKGDKVSVKWVDNHDKEFYYEKIKE